MPDALMPTYKPADVMFVKGEGATLFDGEGTAYLDLMSGIGVTALGHAHPRWTAAVEKQAASLAHVSNLLQHPLTQEVSAALTKATGLAAVFFSNSGTEANECALKVAAKAQGPERRGFVALEGGFHGRTFGSLSVTANPAYREPFGSALEAKFVQPEDAAALTAALTSRPAALILEPIQGEGGLRTLSEEYQRLARSLCDETGTLLIIDEVQTGCGRTGEFLASAVRADIVTLAKPLGGGLPIGATLVSEELKGTFVPGDHGSTFGGGPMALAGAQVVLDELEAGLQGQVIERGAQLAAGLDALVARGLGSERRGRGLMQGLVMEGQAAAACAALLEARIVACTATPDVLRFLPPFTITQAELEDGLVRLAETLTRIQA